MFYNELDILDIRLHELYDVVDKFVIVEANESFSRIPRELVFEKNKDIFAEFLDKIIYISIEVPKNIDSHWAFEEYQRNQILQGLVNCSGDDIIIISDVDEIPRKELFNKEHIPNMIQQLNTDFLSIHQLPRYYFLNYEDSFKWYGSIVLSYFGLLQSTPQIYRNLRPDYGIKIDNGGWHFSYLSSLSDMQLKLRSFSHLEFSGEEFTNEEKLTRCMNEGLMFFNEDVKLRYIPIGECDLPEYVKQNLHKFKQYVKDTL
jgi:beta-1,4-mannosyl-glycoprotein beta-1,4-N-acetylglucosaminyltransferase